MRMFLLFLGIVLILAGCNLFIASPTSTEVLPTSTSQVPQASPMRPTATGAAQASREPQPEQSATEAHEPKLPEMIRVPADQIRQESLCPVTDFVAVQDLGLPSSLGLLLVDGNVSVPRVVSSSPLYIYQPVAKLAEKLYDLKEGKTMRSVPQSSPNGSYISYLQYEEGQPARTLIVQSVDVLIQESVLEREYPYGYSSWIDDYHILWTDVQGPENIWSSGGRPWQYDYIPNYLIEVKTLETQPLAPPQLPETEGIYYDLQGFIHGEKDDFAVFKYFIGNQAFYEIYSYSTQTGQSVSTGLPARLLTYPRQIGLRITSNNKLNFIVQVEDGDVIWIVSRVSIEQAVADSDALAGHVFEFTFPEEIVPSFIPYYFETGDAFLYTHIQLSNDALERVPEHLYRFDIETQTTYDYCLDLQKQMAGDIMEISPDEGFAAMTFHENPRTGQGKKDTILLNLTTGERAILPDYQVFGWVTVIQ